MIRNPKTGRPSRKNIVCFVSLAYAIWYSGYGMVMSKEVHEFVVWGFLTLSGSLLGISSWEKKNLNQQNDNQTVN